MSRFPSSIKYSAHIFSILSSALNHFSRKVLQLILFTHKQGEQKGSNSSGSMLHDISNVSAFKVLSCACYLLHAEFPSLGAATTISRQSAQSIIQIVYLLGKYIIQETVEVFYLVYSSKDFNLGQTIPDVWSAEMLKLSIIAKQSP